ncbi:MAG: hypothetical protein ACXQS6_01305, partial [Candidatus Syntropharchaeales archaeon]
NLDIILILVIIFVVIFYPPIFTPRTGALDSARYTGGPQTDWYESLTWMRENTPDFATDSFNYYTLYPDIPRGEDYPYPSNAYGVMSWWDYGHWITRIAHRIPIANPFQAGIGGPHQGDRPGACVFFITRNETVANEVMDALGGRYVISDFMMADAWNAVYNKFGAMTVCAGENPDPFATMEIRLHMFDGSTIPVEESFIPGLNHYRLVHESPKYILPYMVLDSNTNRVLFWRSYQGNYADTMSQARLAHQGAIISGQEDMAIYTPEFMKPVSFVKTFEYVKGANLIVTPPAGSNETIATVTVEVLTNQGRTFNYTQPATLADDGKFHFTLPYSTEGPIEGETQFDTAPTGPYTIEVGNVTREVGVTERDVLDGGLIEVNM